MRGLLVCVVGAMAAAISCSPCRAVGQAGDAGVDAAGVLSGTVVDGSGAAIAGARLFSASGIRLAIADGVGRFQLSRGSDVGLQPVQVRVEAGGFATAVVTIAPGVPLRVMLQPSAVGESVTVTAYRAPLASGDSPASTRVLTREALDEAASPALDNKLRLVPGVELFRRSSSLVANPTSQGLSLRGLGSTAASRTLVVEDDVPLNDPYGGWIHWTEPPELSIRAMELVRGGASDLYGSSAIGGVVSVLPVRAGRDRLSLLSSYGGENTLDEAVLGSRESGLWSGLVSGGILRTDGYTLVAPEVRGVVDVASNVRSENGLVEVDRSLGSGRVFLRGSGFNEARSNGTRLQTNGTRLWRYSGGGDFPLSWGTHVSESRHGAPALVAGGIGDSGGTLGVRFYGSEEHYRQSFSAIGMGRSTESQTRFEHTPAQEMGAVAHWTQALRPMLLMVVGADTHDVRGTDTELSIKSGVAGGLLDTTARQRQTGVYAEGLWTPRSWTVSAGGRVDRFTDFDARQSNSAAGTVVTLPSLAETVFDPRVGVSRHLPVGNSGTVGNLVWSASAFRAYRSPTQNELYRTGQVGQETTQPNSTLKSERATGWETGVQGAAGKSTVRVSYFWTEVNRPITALTLSTTATAIVDKRENLGQIASRGISIDFESAPVRWVSLTGGYQYADATVTKFAQQPGLVGKWIPQVAHNTAAAQVRVSRTGWGAMSLQGRLGGRQFDDAGNMFLLRGYFRLDAYASHDFGRHVEVFGAGENLFDRRIEVGRTPVLTLGTPVVGRLGLRVSWGD